MKSISQKLGIFVFIQIIFVTLFLSCQNKNTSEKDEVSKTDTKMTIDPTIKGNLNIECDDIVYNCIQYISDEFTKVYPNIHITINQSLLENTLKHLSEEKTDLGMFATSGNSFTSEEIVSQPIVRDVIVCITNFNNPALQNIAIRGISKNTLTKYFTQSSKFWNEIAKDIQDRQPITLYTPPLNSEAYKHLSKYFELNNKKVFVNECRTEEEVYQNVSNFPFAIGFCSHRLVYDLKTMVRKSGIYIVGIDANENHILDNNELLYDDLTSLRRFVKKNIFPADLTREYVLLKKKNSANKDISDIFTTFAKSKTQVLLDGFGLIENKE